MNKYQEMKDKNLKKIEAFPYGFAFSKEQFKQMMEKWGLKETDIDKIYSIGGGGYIRRSDIEKHNKMWDEINKEEQELIKQDKTGEGFIKDMFLTELLDHEYGYTQELDATLDALNLTYDEIMKTPNLKNGLELAIKEIKAMEEKTI